MANYNAFTRTNYFKVTDEPRLRDIIASCACGEDELQLFEQSDDMGGKWFGFGAFGAIHGLELPQEDPEDYPEYDYGLFIAELQKILPEDDAIIITEVGYEKLRYVVGVAIVITKTETRSVDLRNASIELAKEMLQNPEFYTVTEY